MRSRLIVLVSVLLSASLSAGDSGEQKPLGEQTFRVTQLNAGRSVASSAHLISDNGVVAGNLQDGSDFSFVWSAQTGFVVLTLVFHRRQRERHRDRRRRYAGGELLGFIWTPAEGLVTIGDLGGGHTIPADVTSSGLVVGSSSIPGGPEHAFMWTRAGGIVDLDPTGLVDSTDALRPRTESDHRIHLLKPAGASSRGRRRRPVRLGRSVRMPPDYMVPQGALTGTVQREDGTEGTFFWSRPMGRGHRSLGGDEIRPMAINDAGTIVGFGTHASGETHGSCGQRQTGSLISALLEAISAGPLTSTHRGWSRARARPRAATSTRSRGQKTWHITWEPRRKKQQGRFRY